MLNSTQLVVLDFDGTFTDVEKEAGPFFESYFHDVQELLGAGFESEWEAAEAVVASDPATHGWLHEGRIVAPGNADPYLRATVVLNMILDARGLLLNPETRTDILQKLYHANYPKAGTVFRSDALAVVEELAASGIPSVVVTNSAMQDVKAKLAKLNPKGLEKLEVFGNAKKFFLVPAHPLDAAFEALPESMSVPGLARPIYVRRGHYYDVLRPLLERYAVTAKNVLVAGDIFELDLALPAHLGAAVHLVLKDRTEAFERQAIAQLERGSLGELSGLLSRL